MKTYKFAAIFVLLITSNIVNAVELVSVKPRYPAPGEEVFLDILYTSFDLDVMYGEPNAFVYREDNTIEVWVVQDDIIWDFGLPDTVETYSLGVFPAGDYTVQLIMVNPFFYYIKQTKPFTVSSSIPVPTLGEYSTLLLSLLIFLVGGAAYSRKFLP
jgi:hypothetical protein